MSYRILDTRRQAGAHGCWTVTFADGYGRMVLCKTRSQARAIVANLNRGAA